jgi:flagellar protein FliL
MAEPEDAAPAQDPAPAKKKGKMGIIVIAAVVLLVGGGGAILAMKFRSTPAEKPAKSEEAGLTSKIKSMMNLEPFLVNLADADANRFVKVTFRLGLDEASLGEEYEKDSVILSATRDKILSVLSTKTADEILTLEGKDRLRKEIGEKVAQIFPKGKVVEVFILDFVVQL